MLTWLVKGHRQIWIATVTSLLAELKSLVHSLSWKIEIMVLKKCTIININNQYEIRTV